MLEAFISVFILLGFRLLRVDRNVVLLLTLGVAIIAGCTTPTVKEELALTSHDPTQDHRKIAAYYNHEAEGLKIRASGQAKAQDTIAKTLTPEYLRFKLYDSSNSKFVLLPDKLNMPILLNPGTDHSPAASHEEFRTGGDMPFGR